MQVDSPEHRDRDRSSNFNPRKKPKRSTPHRHNRRPLMSNNIGNTQNPDDFGPNAHHHPNGYGTDGSSPRRDERARARNRDRVDRDRGDRNGRDHDRDLERDRASRDPHFHNRHEDGQRTSSPAHRYDPRATLSNIRLISSTQGLESFYSEVRHRSDPPDTPLVLVRHRAISPVGSTSSASSPMDSSDTLSIAYANLSAVIDTTRVARDRLAHLLLLVPCLVVCDSSVAALLVAPGGAHASNLYDVSLGRELLDGSWRAPLHSTARLLNVRIAFPDGFPTAPARYSHDAVWRGLARAALDVRAVFFAISAKLSADVPRWRDLSARVVSDISSRVAASAASSLTCNQVKPFRVVAFDTDTADSFSLIIAKFDVGEDVDDPSILGVVDTRTTVRDQQENVKALLEVLPPQWQNRISAADIHDLVDIQIDLGRPALAHLRSGRRVSLSQNDVVTTSILHAALASVRRTDTSGRQSPCRTVNDNSHSPRNVLMNGMAQNTESDLTQQQSKLFGENNTEDAMNQDNDDPMVDAEKVLCGGFDDDNRGGIPGTLHRVSLLHGRTGSPVGATLRVGRHVHNAASVLHDILHGAQFAGASILVVGAPGSGKTTMVRDAARMLATTHRVMIVDSSDEIGGPGDIPHACVGDARRMSVPNGKRGLASALLEAVENHTPDVVVADELRDRAEVAGVITARQRGVRVLASAHGGLRALIRNPVLRPLVGGMDRVTLGDAACAGNAQAKIRHVRAFDAVFDVVVEMGPWADAPPFAVRIVPQVQAAVDSIMAGRPYWTEMRWRGHDDNILSVDVCL